MTQKDHALHNERACHLLAANGAFPDWVVTTSFYAALHFVQSRIFPFTEDGIEYTDINYYFRQNESKHGTKHLATVDLTYERLDSLGSKYNWLYGQSRTARYRKYKIPPEDAKIAMEYLADIKAHCYPNLVSTQPSGAEVAGTKVHSDGIKPPEIVLPGQKVVKGSKPLN